MTDTRPGRGFAMFPAWLAWKKPSPNAVTVYVHLALFGTFNPGTATYEECRPSKRTLAEGYPDRGYSGTGLGAQTVGRALRELEDLGAIKGEPSFDPETGAQGPTVYRLVFGQVIEGDDDTPDPVSPVTRPPRITRDPGVAEDRGARVTGDTPPVSPVTPNLEVTNQEPLYQEPPLPPEADAAAASPVGAVTREEDQPEEDDPTDLPAEPGGLTAQARAALNAAVAAVQACRPGWRQDEVAAAMRAEVDAGRDPLVVARAMRLVAEDRRSQGPGRLKTAGPWWGDPAPEEPVRVLDASVPRCRVFGHEGYPAHNCAGCKAAARVREDTEPSGPVDPAAHAAVRALVAAASRPSSVRAQRRAEVSA